MTGGAFNREGGVGSSYGRGGSQKHNLVGGGFEGSFFGDV